jgi:hypothetical protein
VVWLDQVRSGIFTVQTTPSTSFLPTAAYAVAEFTAGSSMSLSRR